MMYTSIQFRKINYVLISSNQLRVKRDGYWPTPILKQNKILKKKKQKIQDLYILSI
jgi:hypothetical protein